MSLWTRLKERQKPRSYEARMLQSVVQNQQYILARLEAIGVDTSNRLQALQAAMETRRAVKDVGGD